MLREVWLLEKPLEGGMISHDMYWEAEKKWAPFLEITGNVERTKDKRGNGHKAAGHKLTKFEARRDGKLENNLRIW